MGLQIMRSSGHLTTEVLAPAPAIMIDRRPTRQQVRPSVQRLLDSMTGTAAFVHNGRLDILALEPCS